MVCLSSITINALGQTLMGTDRNGTVHTLSYDVLGRIATHVLALDEGTERTGQSWHIQTQTWSPENRSGDSRSNPEIRPGEQLGILTNSRRTKEARDQSVSRSTVVNILKEAGFDPSFKRGKGTWWEFLERHQKTLWASDFLTVKSLTTKGFVDLFVLFFIHPRTRRVIVSGITTNPNSAWMKQQARNVTGEIRDLGFPTPEVLIIDHDTKYTNEFYAIFESEGTEVKRVGPIAPNLNAFAERFEQTLRVELLDHFVVCGEKHLRYLVTEFLEHYHVERPHQRLGNIPPIQGPESVLPFVKDQLIHRSERLGGLLKHYFRKAA